jgi:hypothetical protein
MGIIALVTIICFIPKINKSIKGYKENKLLIENIKKELNQFAGIEDLQYDVVRYDFWQSKEVKSFRANYTIVFPKKYEEDYVKYTKKYFGKPVNTYAEFGIGEDELDKKISGQDNYNWDNAYEGRSLSNEERVKDGDWNYAHLYYWYEGDNIRAVYFYSEDGCDISEYDKQEYIFE